MSKVFFIGLDAAEPSLITRWMAEGSLPNILELKKKGAYFPIGSSDDHLVGLPWPTFYTGKNPGNHGAYHYLQWDPQKMRSARIDRPWLPLNPFWRNFDNNGPRAIVIDIPLTPTIEAFHGIEINGWATHEVLVPQDAHPRQTLDWIKKTIGPAPSFAERYGSFKDRDLLVIRDRLVTMTRQVSRLAKHLMAREAWDLFLVVFSATHRGGHQLWGTQPCAERGYDASLLRDVYGACDRAVGELASELPANTSILLGSLHGMGTNQSRTEILPNMIEKIITHEAGRKAPQKPGRISRIKNFIPSKIRHEIKRRMPQTLQDRLTVFWRMGGIDWRHTPVISLLGDYDGYLRINLKGRESAGIVEPGRQFDEWIQKTISGLHSFVDRDSGQSVVLDVLLRKDLNLSGACMNYFPDLIVEWQKTPACTHREIVSPIYGSVSWPTPGRNPEGRTGNHRPQGFLIACGDRFSRNAVLPPVGIVDLAPTILEILGCPKSMGMEGSFVIPPKKQENRS